MRSQVTRNHLSATDARNLRTLLLLNVFAAEEIGSRIAQARNEAGFTQDELGDLIELSMRQIQNLESGASKPYKHLKLIAEVTGKPFDWFLHGDGEATDDEDRLRQIVHEEVAGLQEQLDRVERLLLRRAERSQSRQETS
jgi:transcriptional regulator with XRE-family HTH domain